MAESDNTAGSDKLHLGDVLTGAGGDTDNLVNYLHFTFDSGANATILEVKSPGNSGGAALDQKIVLSGVNLTALGAHDGDIISHLLTAGSTHADG